MRIVVAGGSGFLGRALVGHLARAGHDVVVLSRGAGRNASQTGRIVDWTPDGSAGPWARELDGADAVVNLAGAGIADKRWTAARKRLLWDSRILSTRSLVAAVRDATARPGVFVQVSGVGIYGTADDDRIVDESSPAAGDFLAELCTAWEAEARPVADLGCRLVCVRSGVVLERHGGALARMLLAFQLFAGGPIASGRQWMSWIHLDDWVAMVDWAMATPAVSGAVNATSPHPARNADFARALGRALHRPSWMPVPAFVLRILFGQMADDTLIRGQRALPARATALGFSFRYPDIDRALQATFSRGSA